MPSRYKLMIVWASFLAFTTLPDVMWHEVKWTTFAPWAVWCVVMLAMMGGEFNVWLMRRRDAKEARDREVSAFTEAMIGTTISVSDIVAGTIRADRIQAGSITLSIIRREDIAGFTGTDAVDYGSLEAAALQFMSRQPLDHTHDWTYDRDLANRRYIRVCLCGAREECHEHDIEGHLVGMGSPLDFPWQPVGTLVPVPVKPVARVVDIIMPGMAPYGKRRINLDGE